MSELVRRNGGMSDEQKERLGARAHELEQETVKWARVVRSAASTKLAPVLLEIYEDRLWEVLGYDSMNQFLASPYVEISPSYAKAIAYTYRDLVVDREVPREELEGLDLRKIQMALPAIKDGDAHWQEAVSDAKALSREDMHRKYSGRRKPNARLNAEEEPELVRCDTCQSWVPKDRLEDHDGEQAAA